MREICIASLGSPRFEVVYCIIHVLVVVCVCGVCFICYPVFVCVDVVMNRDEFEVCKEIKDWEGFMETALRYDELSMEDYKEFMPNVFKVVPSRTEKDSVKLYEAVIDALKTRWTASDSLPVHGPWHHGVVGGVLMVSLRNNGYDYSEKEIGEALKRGLMIPGGSCGFHGACGAGTGLGVAVSLVLGSTCFHDESRSKALEANSEAYKRIAGLGGPRCCTLSTYTTLELAGEVFRELGYDLPVSDVRGRCRVYRENSECHGVDCPYFPVNR